MADTKALFHHHCSIRMSLVHLVIVILRHSSNVIIFLSPGFQKVDLNQSHQECLKKIRLYHKNNGDKRKWPNNGERKAPVPNPTVT